MARGMDPVLAVVRVVAPAAGRGREPETVPDQGPAVVKEGTSRRRVWGAALPFGQTPKSLRGRQVT